ncbi:MAG: ABC transporter permease subunit [Planctomycetota bacterium]|nr:ABC transporter permease subunit [Planctomycetota bacterium]
MRNAPTIARRELAALLLSPASYVTGAAFLFLTGARFAFDFVRTRQAEIKPLATICYWLPLFLAPLITMRMLAEEKRSGTFEVMVAAPVTDAEVVLGKFLGALGFYAALLLPTLSYVGALAYYSEGPLDVGPVAAGYLGMLLAGGLYLSLGLLASSLTESSILAAFLGFIFCFVPISFDTFNGLPGVRADPVLSDIVAYLSLWTHYRSFLRGAVDSRDICYFVSMTALALYLAIKAVESRRWL